MSDKLLPCPFCGGKASVSIGHNGEHEQLMYVECVSCAGMADMYRYRAEAIAAWNRRYVCPDKNGKPVFSNSTFRYAGGSPMRMLWRALAWHMFGEGKNKGAARRIHGYMLNNIELIEESESEK